MPRTLVLASTSQRRKQILQRAGLVFQIHPIQISEIPNENLSLASQIEELAKDKALAAVAGSNPLKSKDNLVLAADTVVILDGQLLGKPANRDQARHYITGLAGRRHSVITGLALLDQASGRVETSHQRTEIEFQKISAEEIESYLDTGDWADKAGGYGIQSAAAQWIKAIEGSYDNVVGLPIESVFELAQRFAAELSFQEKGEVFNNLANTLNTVEAAAQRSGRHKGAVRLIAVSKTVPVEKIQQAMAFGQNDFGENYVQEAVRKVQQLPSAIWHFIGSLQSNKVKSLNGYFSLIHSVDRDKLVAEIARRAMEINRVQDVLLEVNLFEEKSKSGCSLAALGGLVDQVIHSPNLRLRGLMSLPPLLDNEAEARKNFQKIRGEFTKIRESLPASSRFWFSELSMGTSSDYEIAIEEGATMVRVGTAIFGSR